MANQSVAALLVSIIAGLAVRGDLGSRRHFDSEYGTT
jgi:hypothetical protein